MVNMFLLKRICRVTMNTPTLEKGCRLPEGRGQGCLGFINR
jgi:hypothetical protein